MKNVERMEAMVSTYGFGPAMSYAAAVQDMSALNSIGLGGRLGERHFKDAHVVDLFDETDPEGTDTRAGNEGGEARAGAEMDPSEGANQGSVRTP